MRTILLLGAALVLQAQTSSTVPCASTVTAYNDTALNVSAATATKTMVAIPASAVITVLQIIPTASFTPNHGTVTFTGSGLNDMTVSGSPTLGATANYEVYIDGTGTPDTFKWSDNGGTTFNATGVLVTGSPQLLENGIYVTFGATTGHTASVTWTWPEYAVLVSLGDGTTANAYAPNFGLLQTTGAHVLYSYGGAITTTTASQNLVATFNGSGILLNQLTAGSVTVNACWMVL